MSQWVSRGDPGRALDVVMQDLSGVIPEALMYPVDTPAKSIARLPEAANMIRGAVMGGQDICVFGDYDADGVCSMAIMFLLLTGLQELYYPAVAEKKGRLTIRAPRRMSEGYGLSEKAVDEVSAGLLITVDNGIAAIEAVKKAKEKGLSVIIIDHHIPGEEIPDADVIVNPHLYSEPDAFKPFCGAGLSCKLSEYMLAGSPVIKPIQAIAAIGTIADVVPLHGANRVIVKKGLEAMGKKKITEGLRCILDVCRLSLVKSEDVAFRLAPMLNAPGRLYDNGAIFSSACLAASKPIEKHANQLVATNDKRKQLVAESYKRVIDQLPASVSGPIVVHVEELHEGIVGIVAGKLADSFRVPVYVFTGKDDVLKGSGRCGIDEIHLHELTCRAGELIERFGGHKGAVGLSVKRNNLDAFRKAICEAYAEQGGPVATNQVFYDISIAAWDIDNYAAEQKRFEPFGAGAPKPVFLIRGVALVPPISTSSFGKQSSKPHFAFIGSEKQHLKLRGLNTELIGFGMAQKYRDMGYPKCIDALGKIGETRWKKGATTQIELIDFRPCQ